MGSWRKEWSHIGIEGESEFLRLIYNKCANVVVAQFRRQSAIGASISTLYARPQVTPAYVRLTEPSDSLSYDHPVSASRAPILVANVLQWPDGEGADWYGIASFDLKKMRLGSMFTQARLGVDDPYVAGWVRTIHAASENGHAVVCTIALERPAAESEGRAGVKQVTVVDSWLCELDLQSGEYNRLTQLTHTFF